MTMQIIGAERVSLHFRTIADGVSAKLQKTMQAVATDVSAYVKDNKLAGQVLNRRTGRLSRSIFGRTSSSADSVSAEIGTNVVYAKVHEFGFQGTVSVPAHERMQTMAFGRSIQARMVTVRAHPMRMNLPERSFLRSSLHETAPAEIDRIRASMHELITEAAA